MNRDEIMKPRNDCPGDKLAPTSLNMPKSRRLLADVLAKKMHVGDFTTLVNLLVQEAIDKTLPKDFQAFLLEGGIPEDGVSSDGVTAKAPSTSRAKKTTR